MEPSSPRQQLNNEVEGTLVGSYPQESTGKRMEAQKLEVYI